MEKEERVLFRMEILNTTAKDKFYRKKKILEIVCRLWGRERDFYYQQNPHIGTDLLRKVIIRLRQEIMKRGWRILV